MHEGRSLLLVLGRSLLIGGFLDLLGGLLLGVFIRGVALLAANEVPQAGEVLADIFLALNKRQKSNDDSGTESPANGDKNPKGEVGLGKDAGGDGKEGPNDDEDEGEDVSAAGDPAMGAAELVGVLLLSGEAGHVVLDKLDVRVELGEIIILGINELGVDVVDEARAQDGDEVTRKHDGVAAEVSNADGTALNLGTDQPAGNSKDESRPGGDDGTFAGGLVPGHQVPEGDDGRSDHDTHEKVDPTKVEADFGKEDGKGAHEEAEGDDDDTGALEDLLAGSIGVEVLTVDVVGDKRRDGNGLCGTGGDDGHEKHDKDEDGTSAAKKVVSNGGGDKAGSGLAGGDGEHEGGGGKTQGGGEGEGDREPADTTEEVTLGGRGGAGGDGGLPVGLIDEDGAEVTNDVDDTEHETISGKHGEVGS